MHVLGRRLSGASRRPLASLPSRRWLSQHAMRCTRCCRPVQVRIVVKVGGLPPSARTPCHSLHRLGGTVHARTAWPSCVIRSAKSSLRLCRSLGLPHSHAGVPQWAHRAGRAGATPDCTMLRLTGMHTVMDTLATFEAELRDLALPASAPAPATSASGRAWCNGPLETLPLSVGPAGSGEQAGVAQ